MQHRGLTALLNRSSNVVYPFKRRLEKEFIPEREELPATNI